MGKAPQHITDVQQVVGMLHRSASDASNAEGPLQKLKDWGMGRYTFSLLCPLWHDARSAHRGTHPARTPRVLPCPSRLPWPCVTFPAFVEWCGARPKVHRFGKASCEVCRRQGRAPVSRGNRPTPTSQKCMSSPKAVRAPGSTHRHTFLPFNPPPHLQTIQTVRYRGLVPTPPPHLQPGT